MAVRHPVPGSFGHYATRYLGPYLGFLTGWSYAFSMLMVCLADVTVFGVYMGFWYPDTPRWIWVLGIVLCIGGLNLCSVKVFGELEFWLSLLKVVAILALIAGGAAVLLSGMRIGGADATAPALANLWQHGGFFPNGIEGMIASFTVVMFAFGGVEVIGMAAGEAGDPRRVIPKAINSVPLRILLFYVLTLLVLMAIFPGARSARKAALRADIQQPGNQGGRGRAEPGGDLGRDLGGQQRYLQHRAHALRHGAERPGAGRLRAGVALRRALDDGGGDGRGPARGRGAELPVARRPVHEAGGHRDLSVVWVWLMILLSQLAMRRRLGPAAAELAFPVPLWPWGQRCAVVFMLFVFAVLAAFEDTRGALYVGLGWLALLSAAYLWLSAMRRRAGGASRPDYDDDKEE